MTLPTFADARLDWFFSPEISIGDVVLPPEESHHALHVKRLALGDEIILFDGRGKIARCAIGEIRKREISVIAKDVETVAESTAFFPTIATAIPKGDRWQTLIEQLTEIGVEKILPIIFTRSATRKFSMLAAQRWCREACKQARRARMPEIFEPQLLTDFLRESRKNAIEKIFVADPGGEIGEQNAPSQKTKTAVIVGPEGGLTAEEIAECEKFGARKIKLGDYILRIGTAAVVAANLLGNASR